MDADQVNVEAWPLATVLGLALNETLAVGCGVTVTVVACVAEPPGPVHVKVYVAFAVSAPVGSEPLGDFAPDQAPAAEHAEALEDAQLTTALPPLVIELGLALRRTLGAATLTKTVADWVALPPAPVQVRP